MAAFQRILGSLLISLGLALLVCSLVLVPTGTLLADGGGPGGGAAGCSQDQCEVNCKGQNPATCSVGDCDKIPPPAGGDCSGCACQLNPGTGKCCCAIGISP
jgi:hypothetical protein